MALLLLGDTTTPLFVEALSRALIVHVLQRHSNLAPRRAQPRAVLSSGRAKRVIDYMQAHLDGDLSLAELARIAGLSASRFSRAFRAATGRPPHRFLIDLRIETARELLEGSKLSIIEIALGCGFEQPSHFATTFRKAMGMSPRAWRRALDLRTVRLICVDDRVPLGPPGSMRRGSRAAASTPPRRRVTAFRFRS